MVGILGFRLVVVTSYGAGEWLLHGTPVQQLIFWAITP